MIVKRKFLFFCMIFVANAAFCQFSPKKKGKLFMYNEDASANVPFFSNNNFIKEVIPANFSISQIGFFCKKEWKFESSTKIPFRFRLGDVQSCDRLEGKKGAVLPPR